MADFRRRDFLKIVGLTGASVAAGGCPESYRTLIPYIAPPGDIVPGTATWYATTCRECPAGCGMLAKNRDGRVIKVEGNPLHPVSGGKLCPRGQASLQRLYNPDRLASPLVRNAGGELEPAGWDAAEGILVRRLQEIISAGRGKRIVLMTELMTGTLSAFTSVWLSKMGQPAGPVVYEPFSYEPLRKANEVVFGYNAIPHYRIDRSDFLIAFGAGFLETWLSNVEFARQFKEMHSVSNGGRSPFVYVGPRLSITGNNSDLWITVAPGDEYLIGLGILRAIVEENPLPQLDPAHRTLLTSITAEWPLEKIASRTGVGRELIVRVAGQFAAARSPLALAEGLPVTTARATETAIAANLLCTLRPGTLSAIDFSRRSSYSEVAPHSALKELSERMARGEVDLLLICGSNPVFTLPPAWNFHQSMQAAPLVVHLSSAPDETSAYAHVVLPILTPLESWGDYSPREGVLDLLQPVMGRVLPFDARHLGDILLSAGRKAAGAGQFPWKDVSDVLHESWRKRAQTAAPGMDFGTLWKRALMQGGLWTDEESDRSAVPRHPAAPGLSGFTFPALDPVPEVRRGYHFTVYPTIQFYDGREANLPWLQEFPDPITQTTWGGWLEIHPKTAQELGIRKGDIIRLKSPYGSVDVPANPNYSVPPTTLAMPLGQGHTHFGRYATGLPANPLLLFSPDIDGFSGGMDRTAFPVAIEPTSNRFPVANTDGSLLQHKRQIVQTVSWQKYSEALTAGEKPHLDLPLPEGYTKERDIYDPHPHSDYRWAMVVDLDRCIGCGACVVACYAENNVPTVGRKQMLKQREMSWIRVQRYYDESLRRADWLIMLCQHCDCAPCESVCPVFAPTHNKEGLNIQVYNRCFGTRFCSQNDPYKVRRFNFYTYTREAPLDMQLNPDVTARNKGVMEKCSFCIQRIVEAKIKARNEGRKVRDGDFTTACAQTCPTDALIFGSLLDPESRVSSLMSNPRAYQVLQHLNTKPAVIYLKRVSYPI